MNAKIKALKDQARDFYLNQEDLDCSNDEFVDLVAEKFAELIVQEMCNLLDKEQWDKGEDWVCADGTRIIPQIKEHFGVEK